MPEQDIAFLHLPFYAFCRASEFLITYDSSNFTSTLLNLLGVFYKVWEPAGGHVCLMRDIV